MKYISLSNVSLVDNIILSNFINRGDNMMKHTYQDALKPVLHKYIMDTIYQLDLTDEQVAELLFIDARSYAYFKSGTTMCGATTLLLFLVNICPDANEFLQDVKSFINSIK